MLLSVKRGTGNALIHSKTSAYGIIYAVSKTAKISGSVVAGFPSPAEQYQEPPLDLNELLVKRPAATYFVRVVTRRGV